MNRLADAHQLLADDAAGADGQMTDLGITHLPVREPDGTAAGFDQSMGVGMPEGIHHGGVSSPDGVVTVLTGVTPAIQNGQHNGGN